MSYTREDITRVVTAMISQVRGVKVKTPPITSDASIVKDLKVGSDDATELCMMLERVTGIKPPVGEWSNAGTVGEVVDLLLKHAPKAKDTAPLLMAMNAFSDIQARFPSLQASVDEGVPVELSITMPVQPGLKYKVTLMLQNNDELNFGASNFWCSWFPCSKADCVRDYITAVSGFLAGEYRIIEHYRDDKCVKAELQAPQNANWKTIGVWRNLWSLLPWGQRNQVVVQNG